MMSLRRSSPGAVWTTRTWSPSTSLSTGFRACAPPVPMWSIRPASRRPRLRVCRRCRTGLGMNRPGMSGDSGWSSVWADRAPEVLAAKLFSRSQVAARAEEGPAAPRICSASGTGSPSVSVSGSVTMGVDCTALSGGPDPQQEDATPWRMPAALAAGAGPRAARLGGRRRARSRDRRCGQRGRRAPDR